MVTFDTTAAGEAVQDSWVITVECYKQVAADSIFTEVAQRTVGVIEGEVGTGARSLGGCQQ